MISLFSVHIFRHDRFSGEPYIFVRAEIVTLQILEIYNKKLFSTLKQYILSVFRDVRMSVRMYVIK